MLVLDVSSLVISFTLLEKSKYRCISAVCHEHSRRLWWGPGWPPSHPRRRRRRPPHGRGLLPPGGTARRGRWLPRPHDGREGRAGSESQLRWRWRDARHCVAICQRVSQAWRWTMKGKLLSTRRGGTWRWGISRDGMKCSICD